MLVRIRESKCLLCGRSLIHLRNGVQKHPQPVPDCLVRFTDEYGVNLEPREEGEAVVEESLFEIEGLAQFPTVEEVSEEIFASLKLPRLGGISSGRGWSSVSTFQRCRWMWKRKYQDNKRYFIKGVESPALAIGTLVHTFLALYYTNMINESYPLTPTIMRDRLLERANPALIAEGWRVFVAYGIYYKHDTLIPLAVELDMKDPRTGASCRYDLVAYAPEDEPGSGRRRDGLQVGTYNCEHKTAGRFDNVQLNGWANDGEILGQMDLWERLGLEKRYGKLVGTIVNNIGKQKEPQMHRTIVSAYSWQTQQHRDDLKVWGAEMDLARATQRFPRSRANCRGQYGLCDFFEECASNGL